MRRNMNQMPFRRGVTAVSLFMAGLAFAGCGGSESQPNVTSSSSTVSQPEAANPPTSAVARLLITFDDLGGGPPIIQVYPGVGDSLADRTLSGTYRDGDKVSAECKTEGRTVHSRPDLGEQEQQSNLWIRIIGTPGVRQYANVVYLEPIPQDQLVQLPPC